MRRRFFAALCFAVREMALPGAPALLRRPRFVFAIRERGSLRRFHAHVGCGKSRDGVETQAVVHSVVPSFLCSHSAGKQRFFVVAAWLASVLLDASCLSREISQHSTQRCEGYLKLVARFFYSITASVRPAFAACVCVWES